jgi:hypothetical protein
MSVREWIDKNQQAASIGAGAVVVLAIGLIIYQLLPERPETKAWYTTDDGKTWFKDSNRLVPPFERNGKEAVLAKVYKCNGKEFVAWMERYKPEPAKKMREFRAKEDAGEAPPDSMIAGIGLGSVEYKRPGAKEQWTTELHLMTDMMQVNCPDGNPALIVFP